MRFQYISDLHLEFFPESLALNFAKGLKVTASNLILAGDIFTYKTLNKELVKIFCDKFNGIYYVTGNHCYYGSSPDEMNYKMKWIFSDFDNWHWLDNSFIIADDIKIAGSAMWFERSQNTDLYKDRLNDFSQIEQFESWVYEENNRSKDFLKNCRADVVITHHLPSFESVPPLYRNSDLACFFVCDILPGIENENRPGVWVHGHAHRSSDYMIDKTRVICNPFGYYSHEENPDFDERKVFEVFALQGGR